MEFKLKFSELRINKYFSVLRIQYQFLGAIFGAASNVKLPSNTGLFGLPNSDSVQNSNCVNIITHWKYQLTIHCRVIPTMVLGDDSLSCSVYQDRWYKISESGYEVYFLLYQCNDSKNKTLNTKI